jgi:DNA-binding response OmpR family regulator
MCYDVAGRTARATCAATSTKAGTGMARRILVVDDDPRIADLLEDALLQSGFSARKTTQSLRFYDEVRDYRPDVIVLDLMMPYLDGADEMRLLTLSPDTQGIPVIMITADATAREREDEYRTLGVSHLFIKPVSIDAIVHAIEELTGSPH